jgi:hypothetical protein
MSFSIVMMCTAVMVGAQQQPAPPGALPPAAPAVGQAAPPPAQPTQAPQGRGQGQGRAGQGQPAPGRQGGQLPPGSGAPAPAAPPMQQPRPEPPSTWQNIRIEVGISDSFSAEVQAKKTVSMIVLDGRSGQVRSTGGNSIMNIDAAPTIRPDGRIYLHLTLEYMPELSNQQQEQMRASQNAAAGRMTMYSESLSLVIADGKPLMASQSADPRSERRVSVEVTATILK